MRRNLIWAFLITLSMLSSDVRAQDTVLFDFDNTTEFDSNAGPGTTMSRMGATETVVITSVGAFAPEFEETMPDVFVLTGNTIPAGTSIGSSNSIGVANPSISNADFETFKGNTSGTEGTDFNIGESFIIEFDTDVTVQEINFSSIDDDGGFFIVEVEGVAAPFNFADGTPNDDFEDPFAGLVITAGTDITFSVGGTSQDVNIRISEITVETVGSTVLLGDVDLNGMVNFLDIGAFITVLSNNGFQAEADIDGNQIVSFLDIEPFIAILAGAG